MRKTISLPFTPEDVASGRLVAVETSNWSMETVRDDDGSIWYEIWSDNPHELLFAVFEQDHPNALGIARRILRAVNRT